VRNGVADEATLRCVAKRDDQLFSYDFDAVLRAPI
jgi:hypothetical protein